MPTSSGPRSSLPGPNEPPFVKGKTAIPGRVSVASCAAAPMGTTAASRSAAEAVMRRMGQLLGQWGRAGCSGFDPSGQQVLHPGDERRESACGLGDEWNDPENFLWPGPAQSRAVSHLAELIETPTGGAAIRRDRAGMVEPGADGSQRHPTRLDRHGAGAIHRGPVTQRAGPVVSPAPRCALWRDATGVEGTGAEGSQAQVSAEGGG